MKAHTKELAGLQHGDCFLFCSRANAVAARLGTALGDRGLLIQEVPLYDKLAQRLTEIGPKLVFLDFTLDPLLPGKLLHTSDLAKTLARIAPGLPRVAVGSIAEPESAIAALRAGVADFIDPSGDPQEVRDVVNSVLSLSDGQGNSSTMPGTKRSVLVLGTRPGVGASTLAVHLAGLLQDRLFEAARARKSTAEATELPLAERVALMDLGLPVGDCQLYMGVNSEFSFVDAARELHRVDATLLDSAMVSARNGVSMLSLPKDIDEMRSVSQSESLMLFERIRETFGMLIMDAGGFSHPEFVGGLARASNETWLVTDQSVGSLVSLDGQLKSLDAQHVDISHLKLVVNRYDERYGMTAMQIAERFGLHLAGTLPYRALPLIVCGNQGKLLHEMSERDLYIRAMTTFVDAVVAEPVGVDRARNGWLAAWLPNVHRRLTPM